MNTTQIIWTAVIALAAYFLGGLNPAVLISKRVTVNDIRESGSGNAGATNMLRTVGVRFGVLTFGLDMLKGVVPTLLALLLVGRYAAFAAGLMAIVGHIFPVFLGFKGGKGVSTTLGVLLVIQPPVTASMLAVALAIMVLTGMVSLGSIVGVLLVPLACFLLPSVGWQTAVFSLVVAGLIIFKHRENIVRIVNGTENRIDPKKLKR